MQWGNGITYLGSTALKEKTVTFGLKDADRTKHVCVLGKAGSGRGDLLVSMALQDIARGVGIVLLDATGTSSGKLLERLPNDVLERVVFLDPSDAEYPFNYNIIDDVRNLPAERQAPTLAEILSELYRVTHSDFLIETAKFILEKDDATLITFHSLITDATFRERTFGKATEARAAFEEKLKRLPELLTALEDEGKYIAKDTLVRNLVGQRESKFTLRGLSQGQIVIVDLSRIRMYPTRMAPVVRLVTNGARIVAEQSVAPLSLYLHDVHRYLSENEIGALLSPDRNLAVTVADTLVQEADLERRLFALSRCASAVSFAIHPADEQVAEQAFYPYASLEDLTELPPGEFIAALSIDGVRSRPFFAKTAPLSGSIHVSYQDLVVASRQRYSTGRGKVDLSFKKQDDDDEDSDDEGTPRNFQDAFRNIFAKQAERAKQAIQPGKGAPPHKGSAPAPGNDPSRQGTAQETAAPNAAQGPSPIEAKTPKQADKRELDEDALRRMLFVKSPAAVALFLLPFAASASVVITEVMYDAPGADAGREWIEVQNTGTETVSLEEWKFFEANTNHALTPVSGGAIPPGGYAVIADNSGKFLIDWPAFSGVLYDSSFSLSNTGELLVMRNPASEDTDTLTYDTNLGAAGDGNSLQKGAGDAWSASPATPGNPPSAAPSSPAPAVPQPSQSQSPDSENETSGSPAPQKNIFADAGPDRNVIVGADSAFRGSAIGLMGEPLENARYSWSFGNGDFREGENVSYHFLYPGTYVVVLTIASGKYSASDRATVKAMPADVAIMEVTEQYMALKNNGSAELDLGSWILSSLDAQFRFPQNTLLLPGQEVRISNARTGLSGSAPETVALLYPNGMVAATFREPLFIASAPPALSQNGASARSIAFVPAASGATAPEAAGTPLSAEALLAAPALAAEGAPTPSPSDSSALVLWIVGIILGSGIAGGGVVWARRRMTEEYSIRDISDTQ